jgi:hypothetical protein
MLNPQNANRSRTNYDKPSGFRGYLMTGQIHYRFIPSYFLLPSCRLQGRYVGRYAKRDGMPPQIIWWLMSCFSHTCFTLDLYFQGSTLPQVYAPNVNTLVIRVSHGLPTIFISFQGSENTSILPNFGIATSYALLKCKSLCSRPRQQSELLSSENCRIVG